MFHLLIFIITILNPIDENIHKHYVSITTARINNINHKLEISIKLTAHDIEYHFEKAMNLKLKLGSSKELSNSDQLLSEYVKNHLFFSSKDKIINLKYLGKETEIDETLWIYLEGDLPEIVKSIKIKNDLLIQTFENQQNIVHLEGLFKESYTFNGNFQEHTFYKEQNH